MLRGMGGGVVEQRRAGEERKGQQREGRTHTLGRARLRVVYMWWERITAILTDGCILSRIRQLVIFTKTYVRRKYKRDEVSMYFLCSEI